MSVGTVRGGVPHVFRAAIDATTGRMHSLPSMSLYLVVRLVAGTACKLYFTEADFTADANYVTIPVAAAANPNGEWVGPAEVGTVWLKSTSVSSTVELVSFQRRG
jgi:hypothetical protein